ncbi:hypothetical protein [Nocardia nova]|uniref:hypothetical protein n=1 Tax=Nocardia nova TaxID=37330 RepID=UPI0011B0B281|nr:hypothetical protein [Nocardia nova]
MGGLVWVVLDGSHRGWALGRVAAPVVAAVSSVGVVPVWRYAAHRWEVTDTAVYTRTGWFNQESRVASITRVRTRPG